MRPLVAQADGIVRDEAAQEAQTPTMSYSGLLAAVHRRLAAEWGVTTQEEAHRRSGASVPDWPAFPDSAEALAYLKAHYRLVILSDVDRVSFADNNRRLGIEFNAIYNRAGHRQLQARRARLRIHTGNAGRPRLRQGRNLSTAHSLFQGYVPAKRVGLASAWFDRRHDKDGWGTTPPPEEHATDGLRYTSLAALAALNTAEPHPPVGG